MEKLKSLRINGIKIMQFEQISIKKRFLLFQKNKWYLIIKCKVDRKIPIIIKIGCYSKKAMLLKYNNLIKKYNLK